MCHLSPLPRPPADASAFRPYADDHALARRARVDPRVDARESSAAARRWWGWRWRAARDARRAHGLSARETRAVRRGAQSVVLEPGDVVYFPKGWLHDTEALAPRDRDERGAADAEDRGLCVSLTYRVVNAERGIIAG